MDKTTLTIPKRLATIGGILIAISGIVNTILGIHIGALWYNIYPGGNMGHVGIIAGMGALVIGLIIIFIIVPLYERSRGRALLGGILTIVLGHVGAVAGAIYVGTVGVLLCYIAGIWLLVTAARRVTKQN
jgi:uncharacterized BrkB/YihY/UPF0761 family membrane protein